MYFFFKYIDTLEELVSVPGLPVTSFGDTFSSGLQLSLDPTLRTLSEKYLVHYDFGGALANVSQGMVVMGEGRMFLEYSIRKSFTNRYPIAVAAAAATTLLANVATATVDARLIL